MLRKVVAKLRLSIRMRVSVFMNLFIRQPAQSSTSLVSHSLMPHWLTHLGVLGLFSVAVIDSSVIPLPLPGSTDLLLLWLVAHNGDPWLLAPCAIAGSILGGYTTWHIGRKGGERRYATTCLFVFLGELSFGLSIIQFWLSFFLRCFLHPFHSCRFPSPPVRLELRAGVILWSSARHAACVTPLLLGWVQLMVAESSDCFLPAFRNGQRHCSACS